MRTAIVRVHVVHVYEVPADVPATYYLYKGVGPAYAENVADHMTAAQIEKIGTLVGKEAGDVSTFDRWKEKKEEEAEPTKYMHCHGSSVYHYTRTLETTQRLNCRRFPVRRQSLCGIAMWTERQAEYTGWPVPELFDTEPTRWELCRHCKKHKEMEEGE